MTARTGIHDQKSQGEQLFDTILWCLWADGANTSPVRLQTCQKAHCNCSPSGPTGRKIEAHPGGSAQAVCTRKGNIHTLRNAEVEQDGEWRWKEKRVGSDGAGVYRSGLVVWADAVSYCHLPKPDLLTQGNLALCQRLSWCRPKRLYCGYWSVPLACGDLQQPKFPHRMQHSPWWCHFITAPGIRWDWIFYWRIQIQTASGGIVYCHFYCCHIKGLFSFIVIYSI